MQLANTALQPPYCFLGGILTSLSDMDDLGQVAPRPLEGWPGPHSQPLLTR